MIKKTKIVCTMGPTTEKPGVMEKMIEAGMNVARFNFSHGDHAEHSVRIKMVREAAARVKKPVAILLDTKGPEMRLGNFVQGKVTIEQGQKFIITSRDVEGTKDICSVNHPHLPQEVVAGNQILLADGLVCLNVDSVVGDDIHTTVLNTGVIGNRKRVAAPGVSVNLPPLSEQDIKDVLFAAENGMDFIAASFVQRAADVLTIKKLLEEVNSDIHIISKIENAEGVKNIDEIIRVSDGIMVARGDLGVEIPTEEVPLVQKMIIEKCNKLGKPVITATQMLESMITNPRPTRAEASDVANAILDGTDAVMLSGETANGDYPVEAVQIMAKISIRTEQALKYGEMMHGKGSMANHTTTEAISHATVQVAYELKAASIITDTQTGYAARMVSKYRPMAHIVAVTPHERVLRKMLVMWGVQPVLRAESSNSDEMVENALTSAIASGIVKEGDLVVLTAGVHATGSGTTNMIRVHVIGNVIVRGAGIGQTAVTGQVCIARSIKDVEEKFKPGQVLVIACVDEQTAKYAAKASAIIAEEGGLTSHAAIVGISYGIPVIVGVDGATARLTDGAIVTVDATRGLVYNGEINAR
jgi:pyruvate kinase